MPGAKSQDSRPAPGADTPTPSSGQNSRGRSRPKTGSPGTMTRPSPAAARTRSDSSLLSRTSAEQRSQAREADPAWDERAARVRRPASSRRPSEPRTRSYRSMIRASSRPFLSTRNRFGSRSAPVRPSSLRSRTARKTARLRPGKSSAPRKYSSLPSARSSRRTLSIRAAWAEAVIGLATEVAPSPSRISWAKEADVTNRRLIQEPASRAKAWPIWWPAMNDGTTKIFSSRGCRRQKSARNRMVALGPGQAPLSPGRRVPAWRFPGRPVLREDAFRAVIRHPASRRDRSCVRGPIQSS